MSLFYSDDPMKKLKDRHPKFFNLYRQSLFVVYGGIVLFFWYFVYLAYTTGVPSYDILCSTCSTPVHAVAILIVLFWFFNLYFYVLNEIRFRFWHYMKRLPDELFGRNNTFLLMLTTILTFSTILIFLLGNSYVN